MRVVAEAMLSSAPAESRMRSRADVPVLDTSTSSAPDDRQVLAVALVRPFETCRRKQCPATWGVWTYAGLLLAECRATDGRAGPATCLGTRSSPRSARPADRGAIARLLC